MQRTELSAEEVVELAKVFQEMYPEQLDRAYAELTIRKQAARIATLEAALEHAESEHPHTHPED